jgi:hypothetical protein
MAANWPSPGGVDPLLKVETPLTAEMLRVLNSIQSYRFYINPLITNTAYPVVADPLTDSPPGYFVFRDQGRTDENFESSRLMIISDGPGVIEFSFDGVTIAGRLNNSEVKVDDERRERVIYLRKQVGQPDTAVRIWAW